MTARTLYEKLVESHTVAVLDAEHVLLYVDLHIMNEYTSPQAFAGLHAAGRQVRRPERNLGVVDHVIPTRSDRGESYADAASARQATTFIRNCEVAGIPVFGPLDDRQGIEHVVAPELGYIRPGMVIACGDSHTTTYGALGALGFGIGTSEVEHVLATQTLVYQRAPTLLIEVDGRLPPGCTAKDLVLALIGRIGAQGALGFAVEFTGPAIAALSAEGRMTLCNMMVEAGARAALIAPDTVTAAYLADKPLPLRLPAADPDLRGDPGARHSLRLRFDATPLAPQVTWGTSPDQVVAIGQTVPPPAPDADLVSQAGHVKALRYMGLEPGQALEGLPISHAFIGSCTNSRIEDLRAAAAVLRGRHIASHVRALAVPGSNAVRRQAEVEGLDRVFRDAGFEWRLPGCSMCLAMNDDVLQSGDRCASSTNRNFEGRQGRQARTHLMSPAMVAAAALRGAITDVRGLLEGSPA